MGFIWDFNGIYPLVNIQKAIENGHRNSGIFPMKIIVIFHSYVNVYQRVKPPDHSTTMTCLDMLRYA